MQKLSKKVIDKLIETNATSKQIDWILYISQYQDEHGHVKVYYKDVADQMKMSYQQFYNVKKSLMETGIISAEKNNYHDHDITILDNTYPNEKEEVITKLYVNTNHDIFLKEEFRKMKGGSKLLALLIMYKLQSNTENFKVYKIRVGRFFEEYTEILNVSVRVLREYLTQIREFFTIWISEGIYYITPHYKGYEKIGNIKDNEVQLRFNLKKSRHQKALVKLQQTEKNINEYIIDAIIAYNESDEDRIRRILREELKR